MAEARRYSVEELEHMTLAEREAAQAQLPRYTTVDDLPEPFRSTVRATMDRIDEIRPRRHEA